MLALNGERDMQVPVKENVAVISEALKIGENTNFTVIPMKTSRCIYDKNRSSI